LDWAYGAGIHRWVLEYIESVPHHLASPAPKKEEPFSTPRSWHALSDALHSYGEEITEHDLSVIAFGNLTPQHAGQFRAFVKKIRGRYDHARIMKGEANWPSEEKDRDVLYFLATSFRSQLLKELPSQASDAEGSRELAYRAKALIKDLAQ